MDAHNAHNGTASILIGTEPKSAQTSGTAMSDASGGFWCTLACSDLIWALGGGPARPDRLRIGVKVGSRAAAFRAVSWAGAAGAGGVILFWDGWV